MALVGRLEDLRLAELFQLIALFRKSGKLTLSRGDTTGIFLFNDGKVFHASNGYSAPSLGEFLVDRDLISREALDAAVPGLTIDFTAPATGLSVPVACDLASR